MTNLHVDNTSPAQVPEISVKENLEFTLETVRRIANAVARFQFEMPERGELLSYLKTLGKDGTFDSNSIGRAADAAAWLINAIDNVEGECSILIDHLNDAVNAA